MSKIKVKIFADIEMVDDGNPIVPRKSKQYYRYDQ